MKHIKGMVSLLFLVINIGLSIGIFFFYTKTGYYSGSTFSSVEVVTIVLSSVAILVTGLGIFIAIMAIWGYRSLHEIAERTAERVALDIADKVANRAAADAVARLDTKFVKDISEDNGYSDRDYGAAAGKENGNDAH